ncbi:TPA: hypothetical protein I0H06_RS12400 [Enterococcus faecalis]|nr:hypothetical protein [Enterococcus faecalis]HBI1786598.1 hypothetical protein [Enterococcus faecalis]HBI1791984.1 hypothetical protein [Enterococcus faecalis]HBI1887944.1 hypothetical protein [Enterococcus faecalis]HBI1898782.1 hypothetical protein [Enterococcus faecalis]
MAEIKNLGIFGSSNKGLDKIKQLSKEKESKSSISSKSKINNTPRNQNINSVTNNVPIRKKRKGAPITKFDKVYAAMQSVKLSALTNATASIMVEKYETNMKKDELLRKALNEYIRLNLSQEDKNDLLNSVALELDLFRESHPIIPDIDINNNVIRSPEEIKQETFIDIKKQWGINDKVRK